MGYNAWTVTSVVAIWAVTSSYGLTSIPTSSAAALLIRRPGVVEVRLTAVPDTWAPTVRRYRYIHWNDKVVLVEPSSRRVVYIID